jgi:hypothetical protein
LLDLDPVLVSRRLRPRQFDDLVAFVHDGFLDPPGRKASAACSIGRTRLESAARFKSVFCGGVCRAGRR